MSRGSVNVEWVLLVLAAVCFLVSAFSFWMWRRAHRHLPPPPPDWCDTCQIPLRPRDRHTLTSTPEARSVEGARGWAAVSGDYCP